MLRLRRLGIASFVGLAVSLLVGCRATETPASKVDSVRKSSIVFTSGYPAGFLEKAKSWEMAYADEKGMSIARGDGSNALAVAGAGATPSCWSADRRYLVYSVSAEQNKENGKLFAYDTQTKEQILIFSDLPYGVSKASFDPIGHLLYVPYDHEMRLVDLGAKKWAHSRGVWRAGSVTAVSWSPDGSRLALTCFGDVWIVNRDNISGHEWLGLEDPPQNGNLQGHSENFKFESARVAPVADFHATDGSSPKPPCWADDLLWLSAKGELMFHYQSQGEAGISELYFLHLRPLENLQRDVMPQVSGGYEWSTDRVRYKDYIYAPCVCPDGKTITVMATSYLDKTEGPTPGYLEQDGYSFVRMDPKFSNVVWRPVIRHHEVN